MGSLRIGMVALVFPGQGSQYTGMGKDFYDTVPEARNVFEKAEEILGINLRELCFSGPEEKLEITENCQPAILTVSIACYEALRKSVPGLKVEILAGHSLGEFSSLVAAESIAFHDAVWLVRKRGILMAASARENPGGMLAVIGLGREKVGEICRGRVHVANFNSPGQIVVSGDMESLQKITLLLKEAGARTIPLPVSGAFHSPLMKTAAERFSEEIDRMLVSAPCIPVVTNVTADFATTPEAVKESLSRQITSPIRWEESIRKMIAKGIDTFIEVGPGKVLSKLIARIEKKAVVMRVENEKTLEETMKNLP